MAIHYYEVFTNECGSQNFGDNINPFLLGKLLSPEVVSSDEVCVVGIGTILSERTAGLISHFPKKVVFSTGTGYGHLPELDDSWDIACVRGPKTAAILGLPQSLAVCDGAVLLSDYFDTVPEDRRSGIVFVPHIRTHWWCGEALEPISRSLGWRYLTPDLPAEEFIDGVRNARLVVTEAMHGAILSDTMRVPWLPVALHQHNEFKWEDWFLSVDMPYQCEHLTPKLWNPKRNKAIASLKWPYQKWKMKRVKVQLQCLVDSASPVLSDDEVLERKKFQLREIVNEINRKYSGQAPGRSASVESGEPHMAGGFNSQNV